jgi:hypothetical protein
MGGTCRADWGGEWCVQDVGGETLEKETTWEIILRWIFRKWDVGVWTGSSCLRIETGGGHL